MQICMVVLVTRLQAQDFDLHEELRHFTGLGFYGGVRRFAAQMPGVQ